jgi:cobyrinic acid a,c-diamide synthase
LNPVVQLAGLSVDPVIVTVADPQLSDAVGGTIDGIDAVQSRSTLAGVVVNTGGVLSAVTVNVALQVLGASHELVTVNVTVLLPPHAAGADPPLLVTDPRLHPPDAVAVASHAV